ncbi:unnamed protein product [Leptidea sinapis]|uniref:Uncharacterized protein n=1 Tax=Leptidea sinapis TaxID=189913 RepID=A0A5E4PZ99_9NEOP|nr:unnamed protein product [Leptidea sinapis]
MTSETPKDGAESTSKKKDINITEDGIENKAEMRQDSLHKTHTLMHLVYELPDEFEPKNSNMLKENPPITIVEIKEQNGCETELDSAFNRNYFKESSPDVGNKVVYDVLANNEAISDEFKEVIEISTPDCSDDDVEELRKLLESKPKLLEKYLREYATADEVNRIQNLASGGALSPQPRHQARSTSVTSELIQSWLSSSPVKVGDNLIIEFE